MSDYTAQIRAEYAAATLPYPEGYEPTEWVKGMVGALFKTPNIMDVRSDRVTATYRCVGYNPRRGFWMVEVDNDEGTEPRITNVSEHAIGGTFHKDHYPGAF